MSSVLIIVILPFIMAVCGLFKGLARRLPWIGAVLMIAQVPAAFIFCLPAFKGNPYMLSQGFGLDGVGALFIMLTSLASAGAIFHAAFLLPAERETENKSGDRHFCLFYTFFGFFLIAMYAMLLAQNLGYLWIALEATTLMSAPLVYFHQNRNSLEAAWKYFLLCSVGIAFALFGTVLIYASSQHSSDAGGTIILSELIARGKNLDPFMLRLGFIFCLLGYGTKAGLFPLHSWLPDAHSEAPAPASAMLSGALLNCALVALWRITQIMNAAGQFALVQDTLITAGSVTVLAAGLMLIRQHDIKRMWAYHSVEHMGLLALTVGLGSGTVFLLHAINHTFVKVALFLIAGNLLHLFKTKDLNRMGGLLKSVPLWGILLGAGGLAIVGTPPFGMFVSEWMILRDTLASGRIWAVVFVIIGLTVTFIALSSHLNKVVFGGVSKPCKSQPVWWSLAPLLLLLGSLAGGLAVSKQVTDFLSFLVRSVNL